MNAVIRHEAVVFQCNDHDLVGIIEHPKIPVDFGVLIVTGGPQYRIGSHRQFVSIARNLARQGIPVMRYDYRGMGDSAGDQLPFHQSGPDLLAAIDQFIESTGIQHVALWGLCDGASVCLSFGGQHDRVVTMILLNPWIRSDAGLARTYVRHYYRSRFFSREFWSKVLSGKYNLIRSGREFLGNLRSSIDTGDSHEKHREDSTGHGNGGDFRDMMHRGLSLFRGPILTLLCENDLTAQEYSDYVNETAAWRRVIADRCVEQRNLKNMDHTFSRQAWRNEIIAITREWVTAKCSVTK